MPLAEKYSHTTEEIYALPEGKRAELIDGQIYDMAPPGRIHQELVQQLSRTIGNYIADHKGTCKVYPAPFAVFLNQDDKTYVEPDISVICDNGKLDDRGCNGAPDWVIEIVSKQSENGLSDQIVQIPYCRGEGILDRKSYETYGTGIFVWRK